MTAEDMVNETTVKLRMDRAEMKDPTPVVFAKKVTTAANAI